MNSNRKQNRTDHAYLLKRALLLRMLLAGVVCGALCIGLYTLMRGRTADWIVDYLARFIKNDTAQLVYFHLIRNNLNVFLAIFALAVCFLIFMVAFYLISSYLTKMLQSINGGLDALLDPGAKAYSLPPELDFLDIHLSRCRTALADRARDAQLAEQRKNDLVVYLAHDIRTPLTSVIGYLSLLHEAPDMPAEQRAKYVNITLDKAYRLEELVNEFFEITRYHLQSITLNKKKIDLYYMLVQLSEEFYPQLVPNDKQVQLDAEETISVFADPEKLARVFRNVMKNAVAYSDPGTVIHIKARRQADGVVVTFQNLGNTIPPEKLDVIFEKFFRLDESRSADTGGAGLGLAIAKEIITRHGGTIKASSQNNMTMFTVTLPAGIDNH